MSKQALVALDTEPATLALAKRAGEDFKRLVELITAAEGVVLVGLDIGDIIVVFDASYKCIPLARLLTEEEKQIATLVLANPEDTNAGRA